MEKRKAFSTTFGSDPCPGHCKVLFYIFGIEYLTQEHSLIKGQTQKMLRPVILGELSTFQAYQFKVVYNFENEDWNNLSFEHAQVLLQEMKNSICASTEQDKTILTQTTNSSQLEDNIRDSQPSSKRSKH